MRAVTHVHTQHSWDSRLEVSRLADELVRHEVSLALVTDHDSFEGSLQLGRIVGQRGLDLVAPVAAEIRTDLGDVIIVLDETSVIPPVERITRWSELRAAADDLGALLWLPHPFRGHRDVDRIAAEVEVIEIFNARCTDRENAAAEELCRRHGKVPSFGHDAHRMCEVGRWHVEYDELDELDAIDTVGGTQPAHHDGVRLRTAAGTRAPSGLDVLRSPARCAAPVAARQSDVSIAEVFNGLGRRRLTLVGYFALRYFGTRALELAGRGDRWQRR